MFYPLGYSQYIWRGDSHRNIDLDFALFTLFQVQTFGYSYEQVPVIIIRLCMSLSGHKSQSQSTQTVL